MNKFFLFFLSILLVVNISSQAKTFYMQQPIPQYIDWFAIDNLYIAQKPVIPEFAKNFVLNNEPMKPVNENYSKNNEIDKLKINSLLFETRYFDTSM